MKIIKLCIFLLAIPALSYAFGFGGAGGGGRGVQIGTAGNYGLSMADNGASSFTCGDSIGHLFWESGVLKFCDPGSTTKTLAGGGGSLPSQTGHSGKFLTTNGTSASWASIAAGSGITISTDIPTDTGAAYLNDTTHVLTVASSTGYTAFTGSFTAWDTTPAAFSFTDETDVAADGGQSCGAAITVAETNYPTAISVTGDTGYGYKINGGTFTNASGAVALNDTVAPCVNRSSSNSTATTATITIGGVSDVYSVTTAAGQTCSETPGSDVTAAGTIWNAENVYRAATVFNDTSSRSICKIGFYVNSVTGSPTGNYTVRIYNLGASNELGALVAESTTSLTASQLTSSAYNDFDFSGATLSANTSYAVVFWNSASSAEWAANYVNLQVTTTVSGSDTNQASAKWQTSGAISGTMPTFPHVSGTWTKARIFYVQ